MVLAQDPMVEIVATLDKGRDVIQTVRKSGCDLVLLDLELPDMNGVSLLDELIQNLDLTVIVLTGTHNAAHIDKAIRAGVRCVVSKSDSSDHLLPALRSAVAGDRYMSASIISLIGKLSPPDVSLSPRQLEILNLIGDGETNKEIGYRLGIKAPTVSFHLAELRTKLSVSSNRKILPRAQELGFI